MMISRDKVLFVENFSVNSTDNPMSTLYPQRCNRIINHELFDAYDISKNLDENIVDKYDKLLLGTRSVHLYKCYKGSERENIRIRLEKLMNIKNKFFLIQDMHEKTYTSLEKLCEFLKINCINIIFTFYNNAEGRKIRKLVPNVRYYHLPLHIDTNIFFNKQSEKIYDIMLYGSVHPRHYPFRKRLFELIKNNSDKYNICIVDKPEVFDPDKCENGLCDLINKSKLAIATKSRYDYLVAKYLEIVCSGSIVCGNMASDGQTIYFGNYLKLDEAMGDEEIICNIDTYLSNYEINKNKNDEFCKNIAEEYNLDNYIKKLVFIFSSHSKSIE